jgi:hypothetical protein
VIPSKGSWTERPRHWSDPVCEGSASTRCGLGAERVPAMKKCPYCAEEIQDEAIKCKHCGEMLTLPHCGSPLAATAQPATPTPSAPPPTPWAVTTPAQKQPGKGCGGCLVACIAISAILYIIGMFMPDAKMSESAARWRSVSLAFSSDPLSSRLATGSWPNGYPPVNYPRPDSFRGGSLWKSWSSKGNVTL